MFLTTEQLGQLTGLKRPKAQCEFLAREGYHFRLDARGKPVVLAAEVAKRFGVDLAPAVERSRSILDWNAMERRGMVVVRKRK